jgi:ligand-binding sensor domain-containing protein
MQISLHTIYRKFAFTFLFYLLSNLLFSQFNLVRNFNVKDGLPSSEVYEMLVDDNGYLWFASDMGVSRYNGYEFKNYTTEDGLPDNTIFGIYEDYKHSIWFRTLSGKLAYLYNDKLYSLACNDSLTKLLNIASITSIYVDSKDNLWLGLTTNCVFKIPSTNGYRFIEQININYNGEYIYEIENGYVYGGNSKSNNLIHLFSKGEKKQEICFTTNNKDHGPYRYYVTKLKDKSYLTSIDNTIVNFNSSGVIKQWCEDDVVICELEDHDKGILIGTYNGISFHNKTPNDLNDLTKKFDRKIITSLKHDKENNLWLCTKGHGIFYLPYRNFKYYTSTNGLSESSISTIGVFDNEVVSGHLSGELSFFNGLKIKTLNVYNKRDNNKEPNEITSVLDFNSDKKYISAIGNIYEFSNKTKLVSKSRRVIAKKLIKSNQGNLISLQSRVLKENTPNNDFNELWSVTLPNYSDNIYQDKTDKIWICSSAGLLSYDKQNGLINVGKDENRIYLSRIVDIDEDNYGYLWFVSRGEGIIIKNGNTYHQIKKEDGLSSNMCRTVFIDSSGVVWVGTNNGLNKIIITSHQPFKYYINNFYSENGLLTNEVNEIIEFEQKLWLVHNNGISIFKTSNIKNNMFSPPVYISDVLINNESRDLKDLKSLSHIENFLTIKYNGISYKEPGTILYKYKLEGMDTTWNYTKYTSLTFNTIPPGTYKFVIYAKNNDGYWSQNPAVLFFNISQPWWKTWQFVFFEILTFSLIVFFAFKYRLNFIEKREKLKTIQQTRLSNAELKALRAQMNPHFVFNAINSVQYFITNNDPVSSQKYLSKFAKLIRYVVDNSKPASIPLNKEIEALNLYLDLESLRFENKFEYSIEISEKIDTEVIHIPSMLIQPFVENAIWHGLMHKNNIGKIKISLDLKDQGLVCIIEDNGIGRVKSNEILKSKHNEFHKSVGMSITQERLDIINQKNNSNLTMNIFDLYDNWNHPIGTRVVLNLPFY